MLEADGASRPVHGGGTEPGPDDPDETGSGPLVGMKTLSILLGVPNKRIYMWHQRRRTNGFPPQRGSVHVPQYPGDKRRAPLFDLLEVTEWWGYYDPNANRGRHWAEKRARK